jgi:hypothetical protein
MMIKRKFLLKFMFVTCVQVPLLAMESGAPAAEVVSFPTLKLLTAHVVAQQHIPFGCLSDSDEGRSAGLVLPQQCSDVVKAFEGLEHAWGVLKYQDQKNKSIFNEKLFAPPARDLAYGFLARFKDTDSLEGLCSLCGQPSDALKLKCLKEGVRDRKVLEMLLQDLRSRNKVNDDVLNGAIIGVVETYSSEREKVECVDCLIAAGAKGYAQESGRCFYEDAFRRAITMGSLQLVQKLAFKGAYWRKLFIDAVVAEKGAIACFAMQEGHRNWHAELLSYCSCGCCFELEKKLISFCEKFYGNGTGREKRNYQKTLSKALCLVQQRRKSGWWGHWDDLEKELIDHGAKQSTSSCSIQ